jgi:hypothetical protein
MKVFIEQIITEELSANDISVTEVFENSPLLLYLDSKMGAVFGNTKARRSLASIYAIYSILHFYQKEFFNKPKEYKKFQGYNYTMLKDFCRSLYGGEKLQNHALNTRVNGEFKNKIVGESGNNLIIVNNGKYLLHIEYLYVNGLDISSIAVKIINEYISLLMLKDNQLISDMRELQALQSSDDKKGKLMIFMDENAEARIFEILSYSILKNHYKSIKIYIGYSLEELQEEFLTLYKTGRTNANDGGIDFVMKPLGRFFQVTEVGNYDKYLLDMDKVLHFPITFVIKTKQTKEQVLSGLRAYIENKSGGMEIIEKRYYQAIEEIITINELKQWLIEMDDKSVDELINDINYFYQIELNLPYDEKL